MTFHNLSHNAKCIVDTGASTHMTGNSCMFNNLCCYLGNDAIIIGDGCLHEITHIGDTFIGTGTSRIMLKNVLLVPDLAKNLLTISQLTFDYLYACEFYGVGFYIKEWATNHTLLTKHHKGNFYILTSPTEAHFSTHFQLVTEEVWNQRLGHSQASTLHVLRSKGLIQILGKNKGASLYKSCQLEKMSKLLFLPSNSSTLGIFDKLYCDLWGPALVQFNLLANFSFMLVLLMHFSNLCGLFP